MSMARLDMALADVALAKQLAATLAGLAGPCGALRSQLVAAAEGPPWVKYVLFDAERGIALLDFAPARPSRGIAPLKAFLAESGFAGRYRGELPVVAIALAPGEIPLVAERIAATFAAAPPCTIADTSWCEALNWLLMTADGLAMARVMPAPGAAAPGPVHLAEVGLGTGAAPAPLLPRQILERPFLQQQLPERPPLTRPVLARPFLQQPMPERPLPKRAPIQKLLLRKRDRERPILQKPVHETPIRERPIQEQTKPRPDPPGDPVMRLRTWGAGDYPRAALAIAAFSAAALAIGAVPYLFEAPSPAMQAPAAMHPPIKSVAPETSVPALNPATAAERSAVSPSLVVDAATPRLTTAEPAPSSSWPSAAVASATPIRPAAALDGMATVSEPSAIAAEPQSPASDAEAASPTPASVKSAAALDGTAAAAEPLALAEEEPQALANPEAAAAEAGSPMQPLVKSSAIEGAVEASSVVAETVEPVPVAAAATAVWSRPPRPVAKTLPAKAAAPSATQEPRPIWRPGPVRGAGRASSNQFVVDTRTRETR
jgi:hypothetical protein